MALGFAVTATAQDTREDTDTNIVQAKGTVSQEQPAEPVSKVYFPDAITPERVSAARAHTARQKQIASERNSDSTQGTVVAPEQLAAGNASSSGMEQLSDGSSQDALAQLSDAEREVLLETIQGTDICDNPPEIDAIKQLCRNRIETRSREFTARNANKLSVEERLLGEGLDSTGTPNIESVIERLARNVGQADNFENQAIASVALTDQSLSNTEVGDGTVDPTNDLSPETQSLINALIQQLGGNNGG